MTDLARSLVLPLGALFLILLLGFGPTPAASAQADPADQPDRAEDQTPPQPFVHPGLLHTDADFARMRQRVQAGEQPWLAGWEKLTASRHAELDYNPRPTAVIVRGGGRGENYGLLFNDIHAAYQCALRWKISGETAYADKAAQILNAWSSTLEQITGDSNARLAAGIYGYQIANAAEILRTYDGWSAQDFDRFKQMMLNVFYPHNRDFLEGYNGTFPSHYWANWRLCNIAAMQAIGILCDRRDIYDQAMHYARNDPGNGAIDKAIYYLHPNNLGQWQESGRDQGHSTLGIALLGPICETAWNQGDDLYSHDNNRLLAGAEYVAKFNLGHDVPYQPYAWGAGHRGDRREQPTIADHDRGSMRHGYELIINHYVNRLGIDAPWSEAYAEKLRPEAGGGGHPSSFDQLGLGTLTATRTPLIDHPKPTGLKARLSNQRITLSWWGAQNATQYRILRADQPDGPYHPVATLSPDTFSWTDPSPLPADNHYRVAALSDHPNPAVSDPASASAQPKLLLHLPLDHPDDPALHAATLHHEPTWAQGRHGHTRALQLDGNQQYLALPDGLLRDLADFTFATWVYLDHNPQWARLFDFGDARGRSIFLTTQGPNNTPRLAFATVWHYNQQHLDAPDPLPTQQWTHLAVTLAGPVATLYINGQPVAQHDHITLPPFQLGHTPNNWIGRSQYPADPHLPARLNDLRLYTGALTAQQIQALSK